MKQPNDGLLNMVQQQCLIDWEWLGDALRFRGALSVRDVKIKGEKHLPLLSAPTDPAA